MAPVVRKVDYAIHRIKNRRLGCTWWGRSCFLNALERPSASCKRTPEQLQLLREETHLKAPKPSPHRHQNQDHCARKRPRKSTTVRSVLHTKLQTYLRIRGSFILIIVLTYLEALCTLTLAHEIISFVLIHICPYYLSHFSHYSFAF